MSAVVAPNRPLGPAGTGRRLAAYHLRRAAGLRSTAVMALVSLLSAVTPVLTAKAYAEGAVPAPPEAAASVLALVGPVAGLVAGVFGALLLGHELRHGLIESSLVAFPRRGHFFLGNLLAAVVGGVVLALLPLLTTGAVLLATGLQSRLGIVATGAYARPIGLTVAFTVGCSVLGLSVVALTESQQWGIIAPLVWMNVVEALVRLPLGEPQAWHAFVTPLSSMRDALTGVSLAAVDGLASQPLSPWVDSTAFLTVIACLTALSAVRFRGADL